MVKTNVGKRCPSVARSKAKTPSATQIHITTNTPAPQIHITRGAVQEIARTFSQSMMRAKPSVMCRVVHRLGRPQHDEKSERSHGQPSLAVGAARLAHLTRSWAFAARPVGDFVGHFQRDARTARGRAGAPPGAGAAGGAAGRRIRGARARRGALHGGEEHPAGVRGVEDDFAQLLAQVVYLSPKLTTG